MERAMAAMLGHVYGPSGELVELKRQEKGLKLLIFARLNMRIICISIYIYI